MPGDCSSKGKGEGQPVVGRGVGCKSSALPASSVPIGPGLPLHPAPFCKAVGPGPMEAGGRGRTQAVMTPGPGPFSRPSPTPLQLG